MSFFLICGYFKDATRYALIPCMITSIVFMSFATVLSIIAIINVLINGNSILIRAIHGGNLFVYLLCQLLNTCYRIRYSKRDLLRTEEEELDVWRNKM